LQHGAAWGESGGVEDPPGAGPSTAPGPPPYLHVLKWQSSRHVNRIGKVVRLLPLETRLAALVRCDAWSPVLLLLLSRTVQAGASLHAARLLK
jgi:hypothetical protein